LSGSIHAIQKLFVPSFPDKEIQLMRRRGCTQPESADLPDASPELPQLRIDGAQINALASPLLLVALRAARVISVDLSLSKALFLGGFALRHMAKNSPNS
jgi:hypothetical protein